MTPLGARGTALAVLRGVPAALLLLAGTALLLPVRAVERSVARGRPVSGRITRAVAAVALAMTGIRLRVRGHPDGDAVMANHASWLDILVLNASDRVCFVAKSEVAGWPGIGTMARAAGTLFIRRDPREAGAQRDAVAARIAGGDRMVLFPEGTSTDGRRVLAFKPTLFAAFLADGLQSARIQPVSVIYHAPQGTDPRVYAWWGDMAFGRHALDVLARHPQGSVTVVYHTPVAVAAHSGRKALAAACEAAVRTGFTPSSPPTG